MSENQKKKSAIVQETKGRGLFYGVIAIATFIIMAVGATFAYFTASTAGTNSSVTTGSTTLQLEYISYGDAWMKDDLIPADPVVVEYSVENQNDATITSDPDSETGVYPTNGNNTICKDDYGNSICSIYVFQVRNTANSPQSVSLNIVSEANTFGSLYAMAYEIAEPTEESALTKYNTIFDPNDETGKKEKNGRNDPSFAKSEGDTTGKISVTDGAGTPIYNYTPVYINRAGTTKTLLTYSTTNPETLAVTKSPAIKQEIAKIADPANLGSVESRTAKIANDITIEGMGSTKTFAIVLYILNDKYNDQTAADAEKEFLGHVTVTSGDGNTGVSGSIGIIGTEDAENVQSGEKTTGEAVTD